MESMDDLFAVHSTAIWCLCCNINNASFGWYGVIGSFDKHRKIETEE
jgi:hypothetical protein